MKALRRLSTAALLGVIATVLSISVAQATAGTPYGDIVSVTPQPVQPGAVIAVHTTSWEAGAGVNFFWNHDFTTVIGSGNANGAGVLDKTITVPSPLADGTYDLEACEPSAPQSTACAGTSPASHSVIVQNPTPPPTSPPATATPAPSSPPLGAPGTPTPAPAPPPASQRSVPTPHPAPSIAPSATGSPSPSPTATPSSSPSPVVAGATPVQDVPPSPPVPSPAGPISYDPASQTTRTINLAVAAFTVLAIGGAGGLVLAGTGGLLGVGAHPSNAKGPGAGRVASASVKLLGSGAEATALGDGSWTWRLPGTAWLDSLSFSAPGWLAWRSPLLARLATDGSYVRAMLGAAYLALPVAGLALGASAAGSVSAGFPPVPPLNLVLLLLALGVFDAFSGFAGVIAFAIALALQGHLATAADARVLLGLSGMWFVTPILAGAARPLRRVPARTLPHFWDHSADFVVASLVGAWAVQKLVLGLPGLAGVLVPLSADADLCAGIVLVALVGRMGAEALAVNLYPRRLAEVQPQMVLAPSQRQRLVASVLRTAIFTFVAAAFIGVRWQLWLGAALFLVPQVLTAFEARLPNIPRLYHWLPRGILKVLVMLFIAKWFGTLAARIIANRHEVLADAFVLLALPGAAFSVLALVGRDGPETPLTWWHRGAGAAILLAGVAFVLGFLR